MRERGIKAGLPPATTASPEATTAESSAATAKWTGTTTEGTHSATKWAHASTKWRRSAATRSLTHPILHHLLERVGRRLVAATVAGIGSTSVV